jgi:hypothetical protein
LVDHLEHLEALTDRAVREDETGKELVFAGLRLVQLHVVSGNELLEIPDAALEVLDSVDGLGKSATDLFGKLGEVAQNRHPFRARRTRVSSSNGSTQTPQITASMGIQRKVGGLFFDRILSRTYSFRFPEYVRRRQAKQVLGLPMLIPRNHAARRCIQFSPADEVREI